MDTGLTAEIWAEQWQYYANNPIQMAPVLPLTQDEFFHFCQQNRKLRFERTAKGELILMPPAGGESSAQSLSVAAQLYVWSKRLGKGKAFDSSVGFILPNGANRSPDAAWLTDEQLATITPEQMRKFPPVCPEFVIEVMSPSDRLPAAKRKMQEWMRAGVELAWLIDGDEQTVHVYRAGHDGAEILTGILKISGEGPVAGFELDLTDIWAGL